MPIPTKLTEMIKFACKLHGHIGPYLIIGLKMGITAKKALKVSDHQSTLLNTQVSLPLHPPFSCMLDGLQVATTCTIGNQRLQIENSNEIQATFSTQTDTVKITLTQSFSEQLRQKQDQNQLTEEYALEIAEIPENQLFNTTLE
jgi:formylmethanofuran dehydrogenase subunit E